MRTSLASRPLTRTHKPLNLSLDVLRAADAASRLAFDFSAPLTTAQRKALTAFANSPHQLAGWLRGQCPALYARVVAA